MAEQGVVVERHFGIEHLDLAPGARRLAPGLGDDQGIDLGQAAILVEKDSRQGGHDLLGLRDLAADKTQGEGKFADLERLEPFF